MDTHKMSIKKLKIKLFYEMIHPLWQTNFLNYSKNLRIQELSQQIQERKYDDENGELIISSNQKYALMNYFFII